MPEFHKNFICENCGKKFVLVTRKPIGFRRFCCVECQLNYELFYSLYELIQSMERGTLHVRDCSGALLADTVDLLAAEAEGRWPPTFLDAMAAASRRWTPAAGS